jgi:hypothetical protein
MKKQFLIAVTLGVFVLANSVAYALPSMNSRNNNTFYEQDIVSELEIIDIEEDNESAFITAENGIRIHIPDDLPIIFDRERTIDELRVTGDTFYNGKILNRPGLSFEDADKTLLINVLEDFEIGDTASIAKIYLRGFHSKTKSDKYLEFIYDPVADSVQDTKYITIYEKLATDITLPREPSDIVITQVSASSVELTWTDPTDLDLDVIKIYRELNDESASIIPYETLDAGVEILVDTDLELGDIIKYSLVAVDSNGNFIMDPEKHEYAVADETADETADDTTAEPEPTPEETTTFSDTSTHWAKDEITAMAEKEIVEGNEDGSFDPNGTINRAEAAAMIYRLLGLGEPAAPSVATFTDVAVAAWYAGYVAELFEMELLDGKTATTYVPGEEMNRAEFLQMAMNMYYYLTDTEMTATEATTDFTDLDAGEWYALVITDAYELELVSGKTATTYGPTDPISRGEAATMLFNMFYDMI